VAGHTTRAGHTKKTYTICGKWESGSYEERKDSAITLRYILNEKYVAMEGGWNWLRIVSDILSDLRFGSIFSTELIFLPAAGFTFRVLINYFS
jgi:hypothetical protein